MKKKLKKLIAKMIPYRLFFDLLFWKITKEHNLRESHKIKCHICEHFFGLRDMLEPITENKGLRPWEN